MDRRPTVRLSQHLSQSVRSRQKRHQSLARSNPRILLSLLWLILQQHTLLVWLAVAAVLAGATTAAVTSIVDPTASVPYSTLATAPAPRTTSAPESLPPIATPNLPNSIAQPATNQLQSGRSAQPASPLSAGGAILLSCATGCFALSQWLKLRHRSVSRKLPSLPAQKSGRSADSTQPNPRGALAAAKLSTSTKSTAPIEAFPARLDSSTDADYQAQSPQFAPREAAVTLVPEGQDHPLDWDEPSLADNLDLRQDRPLSYWL